MKGRLFGVGVGPGDPELMTYKAVRIIKECQVLAAVSYTHLTLPTKRIV